VTKARRAEVLPLHPRLVTELRDARPAGAAPADPVFTRIPKWATYRRDFARAGIAHFDGEGRQVDFHALRHTYCTMLHRGGVPMAQAMTLMRHRDARLTMRVYNDASLLDTASSVAGLPWVAAPAGEATDTGTDTSGRE
jgi:integrase